MKVAYVDANVILRFLVGDPPAMAGKARALMEAVARGTVKLRVHEIIVAEVVWVLTSFYKYEANDVATGLTGFLSQDGIEVDDDVLAALALYGSKGVDFVDAVLAVHMQRDGIGEVYSFDKHFDRLAGLQRVEPGTVTG
jgi:predicted nucleic acid-binding protein